MRKTQAFSLIEVCISLMLIALLLIPVLDHISAQVIQTENIKQELLYE